VTKQRRSILPGVLPVLNRRPFRIDPENLVGDVMMKFHRAVALSFLSVPLALAACDASVSGNPAPQATESGAPQKPAASPAPAPAPGAAQIPPGKQDPAAETLQGEPQKPHPALTPVDPASFIVKCDPPEVDFGEIPTGDTGVKMVKLVNTGDKPMKVVTHRVTCGCTALELAPNTMLAPKEAKEVKVQLNGGMAPGPLVGKKVTFVVEGQPDLEVMLRATAVSFVSQEPASLKPEFDAQGKLASPEGKIVLKSRDNQPFKIVSMTPPVVTEFSQEAKTEHEVSLPWEKFKELNAVLSKAMFYFDHPKCQNLMAKIEFPPEWIQEAQEKMRAQAPVTNPPAVVAQTDPNLLLQEQIKQGQNDEILKRIAAGDLDVNTRDSQGVAILSHAAKAANMDLVRALLKAKADIESTDNAGRTPLMHAAMAKNVEVVQVLVDAGASVSARDTIGGTALTWASGFGDAASVKELLDAGSDVEIVGRITGWTPLIWASGFGDPNSIKHLVDIGANVEASDQLEGATPLIHAARTGKVESIKALLAANAKLENKDYNGKTPLLSAAANSGGDATKVKTLLDAGANVHAVDNRGFNALQLARKRTDPRAPDVVALLQPILASETPEDPNTPAKPTAASAKPATPAQATGSDPAKPGAGASNGGHGG
jgi:ankyrin repeat protein